MEKPLIIILSSTHDTAEQTERQLREIFKDCAVLSKAVMPELRKEAFIEGGIALITNQLIEAEALTFLKPGTPYIVADRVINVDTISLLYDIPEGSDALIMNVTQSITMETITQIKEWGIDHIALHPYYPGIASYRKNCEYAIAFGEGYLMPDPNCQLIDLGSRPLSITTCIKLAMEIGVFEQIKDTAANSFMRPGIQLSYGYARQYKENRILTSNLHRLIDRVNRGAIMLNEDGQVVLSNVRADKILGLRKDSQILNRLAERIKNGETQFFDEIEGESYYIEAAADLQGEDKRIIVTIDDVQKIKRIEDNYRKLLKADGLVAKYTFKDIIYESEVMDKLIRKCSQFAKSHSTVAIFGESGCGKELLAQAIHNASNRKEEAFVAVNFAALSSTLCEAELFGYEEGAFTGAKKGGKKGLFELAHKGTIFLDEIGDASLDIQKKILRVIQERQVMRIGGSKLISVDIRIIAATNQDLLELVRQKEFREDLYYRLNVLPLRVAPIRERREDIIPLFLYFLNGEFGMSVQRVPRVIEEALLRHSFHGNVRELHNMAEYTANCMQSSVDWIEQVLELFEGGGIAPGPKTETAEAGWATGIESEAGWTAGPGSEAGWAAGPVSEAEAGIKIGMQLGIKAGTEAGIKAGAGTGIKSGTETGRELARARNDEGKAQAGPRPSMAELISRMEDRCALEPIAELLKILGSPPGLWTREKIIKARTQGDWKESQVKRYLAVLKDFGLISSRTRTGTYLKTEGRALLEYLENEERLKKSLHP